MRSKTQNKPAAMAARLRNVKCLLKSKPSMPTGEPIYFHEGKEQICGLGAAWLGCKWGCERFGGGCHLKEANLQRPTLNVQRFNGGAAKWGSKTLGVERCFRINLLSFPIW